MVFFAFTVILDITFMFSISSEYHTQPLGRKIRSELSVIKPDQKKSLLETGTEMEAMQTNVSSSHQFQKRMHPLLRGTMIRNEENPHTLTEDGGNKPFKNENLYYCL